jgi:hypothetical protein
LLLLLGTTDRLIVLINRSPSNSITPATMAALNLHALGAFHVKRSWWVPEASRLLRF